MMDWQDKGRYRSNFIWVVRTRSGKWIASVAAYPEEGGCHAGPGEQCVPGEFASEEDADAAAKRYIDEK